MATPKDKKPVNQSVYHPALEHVSEYLASLYTEHPDKNIFFHGFEYCHRLSSLVRSASIELDLDSKTSDEAELVAWFYQVGRMFNYQNFKTESHRLLKEYLLAHDLPVAAIPGIHIFQLEDSGGINEHLIVDLLKDAILVLKFNFQDNFPGSLLKFEMESVFSKKYSPLKWDEFCFKELSESAFHTPWGTRHFAHLHHLKLLNLKETIDTETQNINSIAAPKNKKTNRSASLAAYNYFRISFRNHIELSAMADNRSHIMISVNSIMMGIMISFITYQNLPNTNPPLLFPVVVFIITGMTSLIFAIMAAKPRMWRNIHKGSDAYEILTHLSSYSNFAMLGLEQYEENLEIVLHDPELVKINLKKELYYLGKILDIKNRYLVFSYNIFMFGFLVSMFLFLAILIWA